MFFKANKRLLSGSRHGRHDWPISSSLSIFHLQILEAHLQRASSSIKVLKPGPDRTVRPENPQTVHFYGSFSIKNRSMGKKRNPCEPRSDLPVLRTVIRPLLTVPCFHLNLNLYKKKKKKKKKKETQLLEV